MQLTALRTAVRERAGIDANDATVANTVLNGFINSAVRQVAMMADWDWNYASETITSVAGTAEYNRAAAARKTDRVIDIADGGLLQQISKKQAVRYSEPVGSPLGGAWPRFWYVEGGKLVLVPTPSTVRTYKHVYIAAETTMSADTDSPAIPDWAIDLAIVKAALMVTARLDNSSQQQLLQAEERDLIDAIMDETRRARGSAIIESRRDWSL